MTLAVVLLNWNGEKWLRKFLPNTLACSVEAEVFVIDNGSTDNSIDYIRHHSFSMPLLVKEEIDMYP